MEQRLELKVYGAHLWTRDSAKAIRIKVVEILDGLSAGDVLVLDMSGVEVFDFSFANELFGKTALSLATEYQGRFVVAEGLNEYTKENLVKALESMNITMIERRGRKLNLLGKTNLLDDATFAAIVATKEAVTANVLREKLNLNLNAMNERLTKLTSMGLVRRERSVSTAGREQFEYSVLS
jgi:hypothetical protein